MKFSVSSSLALLLLPALTVAAADVDSTRQPNSRLSSESSGVDARYVDAEPAIYDTATKGSLDVPVDRMDGKPHAGPWVETTADRDRKTKSNDGTGAGSAKDTFKASSGNRPGIEAEAAIPNSNGGVMDDPSRPGPKEGTRGTEGGVSEKEKVNQAKSEKVPGSPKEALPLPHSEKQKQSTDSESMGGSAGRGSDDVSALGMLEVGVIGAFDDLKKSTLLTFILSFRNLPIFLPSLTIFHTQSLLLRPKKIHSLFRKAPQSRDPIPVPRSLVWRQARRQWVQAMACTPCSSPLR